VHEVALIEKGQLRREKENALPTGTTARDFNARVAYFAQCELDDWMEREEEARQKHERRIELLRKALATRDRSRDVARQERLDLMRTEKTATRDMSLHTIDRERIKTLRHFTIEAREPEGRKHPKRDRIEDYYHFESKVYAPLPRDGHVGERSVTRMPAKDFDSETLEGVPPCSSPSYAQLVVFCSLLFCVLCAVCCVQSWKCSSGTCASGRSRDSRESP
jgi:hypothetical protein